MLIAQISDPHVTTEGSAIRSMIDTPARLTEAFDTCARLPRTPDVILLTGDLVNDATREEYELLAECLEHAPCPVLPIPGNHDDAALLHSTFAASSACPIDLPDPSGPFHYAVDEHPVRLMAFDVTDTGNHSGLVTDDAAAWLDTTLAARPDTPTIVFMHHVPYATGAWWFDYSGVAGAERLRAVLERHLQVVRVVSGHVHRATSTQWGGLTLSSAPSTAYLSGTGIGDGPPVIVDLPAPVQLFWWTGDSIVASEADLSLPHTTLDLRDMNSDWEAYEAAARQHGPISKERFGG
jgi:3',5'-cyclic AMP phosphodiesterase CpdA